MGKKNDSIFQLSLFTACHSSEFRCDNGFCIARDKLCNGVDNCGDRSDEDSICGMHSFGALLLTNIISSTTLLCSSAPSLQGMRIKLWTYRSLNHTVLINNYRTVGPTVLKLSGEIVRDQWVTSFDFGVIGSKVNVTVTWNPKTFSDH